MISAYITEADTTTVRQSIVETLLELEEQGRDLIKDANTKVIEVALDWIAHRWDAETIHREHPHLSLAQIHAALSYYWAHQSEFDAEIERQIAEAEALRAVSKQLSKVELLARLKKQDVEKAA